MPNQDESISNNQCGDKKTIKPVVLTVGTFILMNITTVISLRGLSTEAEYGLASVFYYLFAALFFLVPVSLVAAELATGWPQKGGVFRWISQALGDRLGLLAIYLQWLATTICFPTMLIFAAVSLAYTGNNPISNAVLAENKVYTLVVVLCVYWLATCITARGVKSASRISAVAGLIGTIIPAIILIVCGVLYVSTGHPIEFTLSYSAAIPDFNHFSNIVLAASVFLFYSGMEINAVHVSQLDNPSRNYPIAIGLAAISTVIVLVLGTLTISAVIPQNHMNLVQSLLMTYDHLFTALGISWLGQLIAAMLAIGVLGQVTVIVSGPSSGLFAVGRLGYLPPLLQKVNRHGVQWNILLMQGAIVTLLSVLLIFLPSVQSAFQILGQLSIILYLLMYIMMFIVVIVLRYREPTTVRPYKIPGGKVGIWLIGGVGLFSSVLAFVVSFIPPEQISVGNPLTYSLILVFGTAAFVAIPVVLYACRKASWVSET